MRSLQYEIYGNHLAKNVFIQPVDDHDLSEMTNEIRELRRNGHKDDYMIVTVRVPDWNTDLTPWAGAPAFGKIPFGDGAETFLKDILALISKLALAAEHYYICGYSLAGLFALWSAYATDYFEGVAGVSPSVWYHNWDLFTQKNKVQVESIYLSLGKKEEKTRNQMMATVGDRIRAYDQLLNNEKINHILEWNPGNHFVDNGIRVGKGIAWLLDQK